MHLQLLAIVLWPRDPSLPPQEVPFHPGMVNVVMGLSRTGKSAVIPIVDYCLGSRTCAIPKKVVRTACSWFGIVIETKEGQKLLARREPGGSDASDEMYVVEGTDVVIPNAIEEGNTTRQEVKRKFDELAALSHLAFRPDATRDSLDYRPSFRDLMAFVFQPQNVIANRDVLFYRTEKLNHKIKLARNVLPYVLGAISGETLADIAEIERLEISLRRKERQLKGAQKASSRWEAEINGHLERAGELGLIAPEENLDLTPDGMLALLRKVAQKTADDFRADSSTITKAVEELARIEHEEAQLSEQITLLKSRQSELSRLREGAGSFQEALQKQRDRLGIADWLAKEAGEHNCPICGSGVQGEQAKIAELQRELRAVEKTAAKVEQVPVNVDREVHVVRQEMDERFEAMNDLRKRRAALTGNSEEARKRQFQSLNVALFLGQLKQAVATYDDAHDGGELRTEITALTQELRQVRAKVDQKLIDQRLEHAVGKIANHIAQIMPMLDNDHPTDRAELVVGDLTLRIVGEDGVSYLWSIGSGSNHLSYHLATLVALHSYFLEMSASPVPSLLIFDQPSQVYFPERMRATVNPDETWTNDHDCEAVRKIFSLLGKVTEASKGRLQIVVLDHAPREVWGNLPGVTLTADWRSTGKKLVPANWPGAQS